MKRVACKRQTFLLAHRWPLSGDERVETFAVRKLYETTILINLRVDGLIRSHRLIESIFRVRVIYTYNYPHILPVTLTFVERPRIISPNSAELSYDESKAVNIRCEDVAKPGPDVS